MPDPILPEIESVKTIIFRACTAWETQTGRKLGDEASILEFLRALKTDDQLLNADQATGLKVRAALGGLDLSAGASLPGILSTIGVTGKSQEQFLSTLKHSSQREARIKDAFAADSPADTARALETIAFRDNPQSLFAAFFSARPAFAGKMRAETIVLLSIFAALLVLCVFITLGPQLYKGVTPDAR